MRLCLPSFSRAGLVQYLQRRVPVLDMHLSTLRAHSDRRPVAGIVFAVCGLPCTCRCTLTRMVNGIVTVGRPRSD